MDLDQVREFVQSLDTEDYIQFMKEVHFDYPLRTKEVTDEIIDSWKKDQSMKTEKFFAIIDEREEEYKKEVQEKRSQDLQRIQDLKSRNGLHPLEIFPKEIWLMFIDQLKPEDKRNVREVHELFDSLTEKTHVSDALLPMILCLLLERAAEEKRQQETGPFVLGQLLGEWRLISKSMRNAIDDWLDKDLISSLRSGNKKAFPVGVVSVNLYDKGDLDGFMKMKADLIESSEMKKSPRFFARSFAIDSDIGLQYFEGGDEQWIEFPQILDSILDRIGDQVWYFSFDFHRQWSYVGRHTFSFGDRYISLLGWLSRMKNLKWVRITIDQHQNDTDRDFQLPADVSPLPELPHLERMDLELKEPNQYMSPVFDEFLKAYSHVKILNLDGIKSAVRDGFIKEDTFKTFSALEVFSSVDGPPPETPTPPRNPYLYPTRRNDPDPQNDDEDWTSVSKSVLHMNWPLRQIDFKMALGNQSVYRLVRSLNHVPTLERIILSIKDVTILDDISFLKLPQLTHFEFKMETEYVADSEKDANWSFFFSLQFLIFAKKLNTLIWNCDMGNSAFDKVRRDVHVEDWDERLGEMIDFGGGISDISCSNLWHVFPWLSKVKVELVGRDDTDYPPKKKDILSKEYCRSDLDLS